MGAGLQVRDELSQSFFWLRQFEMRVRGVDGGARWYTSSELEARIQYSWFEAAVAGSPTLCISNLRFFSTVAGQGFIEALADWFSSAHHALEAEVLVIEHPGGAALCEWLAASAFERSGASGGLAHSWYFKRTPVRIEAPMAAKPPQEALTGIWLGLEGFVGKSNANDAYEEEETQVASKAALGGSNRDAIMSALRNSKGPADGFVVAKAAKVSPLQATRAMEKMVAEGLLVKKDTLDGFNDPSATFEAMPPP
ncbi:hypothetical protein [Variovorax sp. YR216]|uniref:hypothetical protein n=1 Tax=Variovorax sp. YR216 TaxID=1882828 RepID=UPI0008989BE3|nr:hypothetical protein [Variovorax sp. YR216]SEB24414.1 hypothetical protein SAMN05444680_12058 [Variovorax sp. YR216]